MRLDATGRPLYDPAMTERRQDKPAKGDRDARLKAALKANIARRKARAQAVETEPSEDSQGDAPHASSKED
ncbi:hypothetical protein [Rubellimicrobium arenae]|uniref:hypothetical protein n=2 Tax=Rubellimicrobium arenae TaxID=2817372 RepID=UPI001B30BCB6|nr:hypothetical protein [Rubellimicrobium arenae]